MRALFNVVFRIISTLLGVLVALMGCIWISQGLGVAPGALSRSFMENNHVWIFWGLVPLAIGIGQIIWSNTRQGAA
ncbi:MAG TPA: hypothetical protein VKT30_11265 [Caulobacteraceae bacterium]|nr:hypothetical protein [Caulobacteraceae bacterium]